MQRHDLHLVHSTGRHTERQTCNRRPFFLQEGVQQEPPIQLQTRFVMLAAGALHSHTRGAHHFTQPPPSPLIDHTLWVCCAAVVTAGLRAAACTHDTAQHVHSHWRGTAAAECTPCAQRHPAQTIASWPCRRGISGAYTGPCPSLTTPACHSCIPAC